MKTMQSPSPGALLALDPARFAAEFPRRPFVIGHALTDHPLLSLPRLMELAQRLPESPVEYNAGDIVVNMAAVLMSCAGVFVEDALHRIEERSSWVALKHIEVDPEYRALIEQCLDEIQPLSEPLMPGMGCRQGFVVISSPDCVTPYHMDHEHNFLLQVRGSKFISMFDEDDRQVLSEREIEDFYSGAPRNLVFRDEYQRRARCFELGPGQGLHFPVNAPHHVRTGAEVCISFGITFRTTAAQRRRAVYAMNARLRRLGLEPVSYGRSPLRDTAKSYAVRVIERAARAVARP